MDLVYVENERGGMYLERQADLLRHGDVFARVRDQALSVEDTASLLTRRVDGGPGKWKGAVMADLSKMRWRKATRSSGNGGACVELANVGAVRDSKKPTGPALQVDPTGLINAVKAGNLDR